MVFNLIQHSFLGYTLGLYDKNAEVVLDLIAMNVGFTNQVFIDILDVHRDSF